MATYVSSSLPTSPFFSNTIHRRINYRVSRLRRKYALNAEDAKDLRQDFLLTLVRAERRYDPTKCPLDRYISMVLNWRYKHHVRELAREDEAEDVISLDEMTTDDLEELVEPAAERRLRQLETRLDIETILNRLSDDDRTLCRLLMMHSPRESAEMLGIHTSTVYRRAARLRDVFSKAGLGASF